MLLFWEERPIYYTLQDRSYLYSWRTRCWILYFFIYFWGNSGSHFFRVVVSSFSTLWIYCRCLKYSSKIGFCSLNLHSQMKCLLVKKQKLICKLYLEVSGLSPKQVSTWKAYSLLTILQACIHEKTWFQKQRLLLHSQNKWKRLSLPYWQKVHFSLSIRPIFLRKLLVESRRCRNLKLKTMSFELLVHVKAKT